MKLLLKEKKVNPLRELLVSYDVSKDDLHYYLEVMVNEKLYSSEGKIDNKVEPINEHFKELDELKQTYNFENIRIICEPSGGYERKLLKMADAKNYLKSYVSSEATNKGKVIESNDSEKSDPKDTRLIMRIAQLDKTLSCRSLDGGRELLREMNMHYESLSWSCARLKTELYHVSKKLFPDLGRKNSFLFTKTGKAIIHSFGLNPHIITKYGFEYFRDKIMNKRTHIRIRDLEKIYRNAVSCKNILSYELSLVYETFLLELYKHYEEYETGKEKLKVKMT
jgi:hypothetical protein